MVLSWREWYWAVKGGIELKKGGIELQRVVLSCRRWYWAEEGWYWAVGGGIKLNRCGIELQRVVLSCRRWYWAEEGWYLAAESGIDRCREWYWAREGGVELQRVVLSFREWYWVTEGDIDARRLTQKAQLAMSHLFRITLHIGLRLQLKASQLNTYHSPCNYLTEYSGTSVQSRSIRSSPDAHANQACIVYICIHEIKTNACMKDSKLQGRNSRNRTTDKGSMKMA